MFANRRTSVLRGQTPLTPTTDTFPPNQSIPQFVVIKCFIISFFYVLSVILFIEFCFECLSHEFETESLYDFPKKNFGYSVLYFDGKHPKLMKSILFFVLNSVFVCF